MATKQSTDPNAPATEKTKREDIALELLKAMYTKTDRPFLVLSDDSIHEPRLTAFQIGDISARAQIAIKQADVFIAQLNKPAR